MMKNEVLQITRNKKVLSKDIGGVVLGVFLFVLAFVAILNLNSKVDFLVVFTFIMNGLLSGSMIVISSKRYPYSLGTIHWIFFFFFFFFAPIVQYASNEFPWELTPTVDELFKANILLFFWGVLFIFGSWSVKKRRENITVVSYRVEKSLQTSPMILNGFTVVSICITVYYLLTVGFVNLLSRGTSSMPLETDSVAIVLLFDKITRGFVLFNFVLCAISSVKNNFRTIISFLCLLICVFPTGVARNVMAIAYVGLFALLLEKRLTKREFTFVFLLGLIIIFPLLNAFRNNSIDGANAGKVFKMILSEFLGEYTKGDYDAYSMLIQTFRYVDRYGVEWGRQFIGAALFFVPRAIWNGKPIGSGATIMESLGRTFTNVSCPLPGEFFINFGSIGLFCGGFLFGCLMNRLDTFYWRTNNLRQSNNYTYIDILYPFLLSAFFFMLRGDLMSSFSYTLSYVVIAYIMCFIVINKNKFGIK